MPHDARRKQPRSGNKTGAAGEVAFSDGRPKMRAQRSVRMVARQGAEAAALISDPRFRHRVQHLEPLGNRVVGELLAQLAVEYDCRPMIERWIDRAIENEDAIKKFGFDRWPPLPMRVVR